MARYIIGIRDEADKLTEIRTRSGMLKGWYFPIEQGQLFKFGAARFFPGVYGDPQYRDFPEEWQAVAWIAEFPTLSEWDPYIGTRPRK